MSFARKLGSVFAAAMIVGAALATIPESVAAEPAVEATAARIAGDKTRTRFVLDMSESVEIAAFGLPDPYRIIIDLPNVTFALPETANGKGRGLISGWRYGQFAKGKARIVIDTDGPARIDKTFVLPSVGGQPARLVLDLVKSTREAFLRDVADARAAAAKTVNQTASGKGDRQPIRTNKRVRPLIVLDPGHGGIDSGAVGKAGTLEKAVVLDFSSVLKRELEKTGRFEVHLTRSDDTFIPLGRRVKAARSLSADLFISIHADSLRQRSVRGATVYTLSEKASDRLAAQLAIKENQSDILAGLEYEHKSDDVSDILIDLTRRETKNFSIFFANTLVAELESAVKLINNAHRSADFHVLKAADVPSVLLELGYLSNEHDEQLLKSDEWRTRTAAAIAAATDRFFEPRLVDRKDASTKKSVAGVARRQQ